MLQFIARGWKAPAGLPTLSSLTANKHPKEPAMNATAKTVFTALLAIASAATLTLAQAQAAAPKVQQLERVVVTGKRLAPEQRAVQVLPRVVVSGTALRQPVLVAGVQPAPQR
jgi:hypothetical protein